MERFAEVTLLPLGEIRFEHHVSSIDEGVTRVSHRAEIRGAFSLLYGWVIGREIDREIPLALKQLVEMAQRRESYACAETPRFEDVERLGRVGDGVV